jgi:hypothetical protein
MRLGNRSDGSVLVHRLVDNEDIALLDVFSQALPRLGAEQVSVSALDSQRSESAATAPEETAPSGIVAPPQPPSNGFDRAYGM